MKELTAIPAFSFLLDLVWLADHPGDRVVYRHLLLSPLKDVLWPDGVPKLETLALDVSRTLAENGLVGALSVWRRSLGACAEAPWQRELDEKFDDFLKKAEEFETVRADEEMFGDFLSEMNGEKT